MSSESLFRLCRAVIFLLISFLIIYIGLVPNDFRQPSYAVHYVLFAWAGAFIMRRPRSVGGVVLLICAAAYAAYIDEGLALGAFVFLGFATLVRSLRAQFLNQSFAIEWAGFTAIFFAIELARNFLLTAFFTDSFGLFDLLKYAIGFGVAYPLASVLIYITLGSRQKTHKEE